MKKQHVVVSTRKQQVLINDPIEALIARMCDPADVIYDKNVADSQPKLNEDTEQR